MNKGCEHYTCNSHHLSGTRSMNIFEEVTFIFFHNPTKFHFTRSNLCNRVDWILLASWRPMHVPHGLSADIGCRGTSRTPVWPLGSVRHYSFLAHTCPFFGATVPLFWISGDISSGFQSQSGFCLIRYFCGGRCNVHSPRFTSGGTLADLLAADMQPVTSPYACAEVGLGSDSNVQSHELKTNALPLCQQPGSTMIVLWIDIFMRLIDILWYI